MVGQAHIRIPRPGLLGLLRHLNAGSPFELMCEARTFFRLGGIVVGLAIGSSSTSTLAEVEEAARQDEFISDYSGSAPTYNVIVNSIVNNYYNITNQVDEYPTPANIFNNGTEFIQYNTENASAGRGNNSDLSKNVNSFGDVFVPEAVWSLDVSTGVHLDHLSGEFGSEFGTTLGGRIKNADFWTRAIPSLWTDKNAGITSDVPPFLPLQLQVASCGGNSAEHSDLDLCSIDYNDASQSVVNPNESRQYDGTPTIIPPDSTSTSSSSTYISSNYTLDSSNATSVPSQEPQPDTSQGLSSLIPPSVNNAVPQSNLIDISALSDYCDDGSASCGTLRAWDHRHRFAADDIDPPTAPTNSPAEPMDSPTLPTDPWTAPIEYPTAPIDSPTPPDLPPPTPVISVGDPGPVSEPLPISAPPLIASPVPETSTWIMMMFAFGIMVIACRKRDFHLIRQAFVRTSYKLIKKSFFITTQPSYVPCDNMGDGDAEVR
jgi:hypothetical protein